MAGHRRAVHGRPGRPTQAESRWARRREFMAERVGRAAGPSAHIAAVMEYARAAARELPPAAAQQLAHEIRTAVVDAVDAAAGVKGGGER